MRDYTQLTSEERYQIEAPHSTGDCNTCCMKRPRGKLCSSCDRTPRGRYDVTIQVLN